MILVLRPPRERPSACICILFFLPPRRFMRLALNEQHRQFSYYSGCLPLGSLHLPPAPTRRPRSLRGRSSPIYRVARRGKRSFAPCGDDRAKGLVRRAGLGMGLRLVVALQDEETASGAKTRPSGARNNATPPDDDPTSAPRRFQASEENNTCSRRAGSWPLIVGRSPNGGLEYSRPISAWVRRNPGSELFSTSRRSDHSRLPLAHPPCA